MSAVRQLQRWSALLDRFRHAEEAAAAVEFALVLPFMLMLYFGSMEASALFTADKRVNTISAAIGDLVAQWNPADNNGKGIAASTLTDYLNASASMIIPYPSTGLKIVVSLVEVKADGTTKVLWTKTNGGASPRTVGGSYAPFASTLMMNQVSRGGCIVAAEASYSYTPLLGQFFTSAIELGHINYFVPRYGNKVPIMLQNPTSPNGTITATACTA